MASYSTNEFKSGLKLLLDNEPFTIVENEFVKPGKGQAFNRVKLRNLKTGRVVERTFKSGDSAEAADVIELTMNYLYNDGDGWHFMEPESYEQYAVSKSVMGDTAKWLKGDNEACLVMLWNNEPILVTAPNFVVLQITQTEPGIRGDTSGGGSKQATLETGAVVRVPLFLNEGDLIKIDTRIAEYVSRAKE